jgi:hypothetical protein
MAGYDHINSRAPMADLGHSADGSRQSPEAATADAPSGLCFDDTAFHEPNEGQSDGKSRRAAPWPFLIRRLG